jgi:hypothetical protein
LPSEQFELLLLLLGRPKSILTKKNIKMNRKNHKNILRNFLAFSVILAMAGLMGSCKAHEKCPAYGKAQPANHSTVRNS